MPYSVKFGGVMAVPIKFLDRFDPKQFELVGTIGASGEHDVGKPILEGECIYKRILIRRV